jgi:hypothetical protein
MATQPDVIVMLNNRNEALRLHSHGTCPLTVSWILGLVYKNEYAQRVALMRLKDGCVLRETEAVPAGIYQVLNASAPRLSLHADVAPSQPPPSSSSSDSDDNTTEERSDLEVRIKKRVPSRSPQKQPPHKKSQKPLSTPQRKKTRAEKPAQRYPRPAWKKEEIKLLATLHTEHKMSHHGTDWKALAKRYFPSRTAWALRTKWLRTFAGQTSV